MKRRIVDRRRRVYARRSDWSRPWANHVASPDNSISEIEAWVDAERVAAHITRSSLAGASSTPVRRRAGASSCPSSMPRLSGPPALRAGGRERRLCPWLRRFGLVAQPGDRAL